nr:cytochrome c oxidase assembly protein [Gordonia jinghuaiqii]
MLVAAVAIAVYGAAALRCRQDPRGWSGWRTAGFVVGVGLLVVATVPAGSDDLSAHMIGHLLIGMYAPLALALSAPVTLLLRSTPAAFGRRLMHIVRSRPARIVAHPVVLLVATVGGLVALYFTPLFDIADSNPVVHAAVHVHFFVSGYLFAWMIAGPDPAPERPSVPVRLVLIGIAVAAHAVIAQLIHAGLFLGFEAPADELRSAGSLMYYWGDIAEILLALAMLRTWRTDRALSRPRGRSPAIPVAHP